MTKASVERYDFTEHTPYELSALPRSLTACGDWETLIAVLTYIGFVDAKCRTGASAELLADYTRARAQIPDAIQEQHAEDARRRRLRNYAEGLAQHPEAIRIPPSVYLPGASASASKRHLAPRGRVAALSAFESFLRTQLEALTRFGSSRGFAVQQAHSAAATGPVSESAAGALGRFPSTPFVLCEPAFRPTYATRQATRHTITLPDAHFRCIAMTPDGSRAATGGDDAIIRLWDIEAGQCLRILRDQPDRVFAVALSADGRRLVSGTYDGRIRYWDTENGDLLHEVAAHEGTVLAVGISADGAILVSGGEDRIVRVWRDSTCVCSLSQESQTSVRCVALTPDGSRAVCGHFVDPEEPNSNTILLNLWDMHRGTLLRSFWQSDGVCCVDLAQNGRCCVSGDTKGNVCLWHDDADRPTMVLPTGGTWIRGVRLSADGDLLFALDDAGCLRVWRVQTGELVRRLRVHTADCVGLAITADGSVATTIGGMLDRQLRVWDLRASAAASTASEEMKRAEQVFLLDSRDLVVAADRESVRSRRMSDNTTQAKVEFQAGMGGWSVSDDQRMLTAIDKEFVPYVWTATRDEHPRAIEVLAPAFAVLPTADERSLIAVRPDASLDCYDLLRGERSSLPLRHREEVTRYIPFDDGRFALTCGKDSTLRIWDLHAHSCVRTIPLRAQEVAIGLTPAQSILLTCTRDSVIEALELRSRRRTVWLAEESKCFETCTLSPSGHYMASSRALSSPGDIYLWDLMARKLAWRSDAHTHGVIDLTFTPDGRFLYSAGLDNTIQIWRVGNGTRLAVYFEPDGIRSTSAVSPDGRLAIGTMGGEVRVLRLTNFELGPPMATSVYRWDHGCCEWQGQPSVRCPWCRCTLEVPTSALPSATGDTLQCAREPYAQGGHDEPLQLACPECRRAIRLSSYVIDNRDGLRKRAAGVGSTEVEQICEPGIRTQFNDLSKWVSPTDQGARCVACGGSDYEWVAETSLGQVCGVCVENAIEAYADDLPLRTWTGRRIADALRGRSGLGDLLALLVRWNEVQDAMAKTANCAKVLRLLVRDLGYVVDHPLAGRVRQLALSASIRIGPPIVPMLLERARAKSWQLRANVILAAAAIDLQDEKIQGCLQEVAHDRCAEVRMRVPSAISHRDTVWTRRLLERLLDDLDKDVREAAFEVADQWDVAAGTMDPSQVGIRKVVEGAIESEDPSVRRNILNSLKFHKATWSRKAVEQLARDKDATVRAAAKAVLTSWEPGRE